MRSQLKDSSLGIKNSALKAVDSASYFPVSVVMLMFEEKKNMFARPHVFTPMVFRMAPRVLALGGT